jgi:NAD(P)-dependent dehydrogenase (short-subunit alcohol dehydrogenase family)
VVIGAEVRHTPEIPASESTPTEVRPMAISLRGLEGKNVLITGAAKGQGLGHAMAFADAGADIAALDITDAIPDIYPLATAQMLEDTVAAVEAKGRRCLPLPCDIRDETQVEASVAKALDHFGGRIDVLVNNAGVAALDSVQGMRSHVLDAVIDTIVKGHMYAAKYVVPNMIERRAGKIINISSGVTGAGVAQLSHYVAAKYAINGLTSAWAFELAEFGINVNAIAPATIRPGEGQGSGMVQGLAEEAGMTPEEAFEAFSAAGNMPGEKWRTEIAHITDAVLFLASDNADQITGHVLRVDAGQGAK